MKLFTTAVKVLVSILVLYGTLDFYKTHVEKKGPEPATIFNSAEKAIGPLSP